MNTCTLVKSSDLTKEFLDFMLSDDIQERVIGQLGIFLFRKWKLNGLARKCH